MKKYLQLVFLVMAWIVPSINALILLFFTRNNPDHMTNMAQAATVRQLEAFGLSFSYTLILFFILMFVAIDIIKRNPIFKTFLLGFASCIFIPIVMGFLSETVISSNGYVFESSVAAGALAGTCFAVPYLSIATYRLIKQS